MEQHDGTLLLYVNEGAQQGTSNAGDIAAVILDFWWSFLLEPNLFRLPSDLDYITSTGQANMW